MDVAKFLEIAEKEIGVKEYAGPEANARIIEYDATTTLAAKSDEVAWCSSFANWVVKQAGLKGTGLANARSWLAWGQEIKTPVKGAVIVFKRGSDPAAGHVGFFVADLGNGYLKVLGGNQSNQVKYSNEPKADLLGYRIPSLDVREAK